VPSTNRLGAMGSSRLKPSKHRLISKHGHQKHDQFSFQFMACLKMLSHLSFVEFAAADYLLENKNL